jgi:hypothetical protein
MALVHTIEKYFPQAFWQAKGNVKRCEKQGPRKQLSEKNRHKRRSSAMTTNRSMKL